MADLVTPDPGTAQDLAAEMSYEDTINPGLVGSARSGTVADQADPGYTGSAMGGTSAAAPIVSVVGLNTAAPTGLPQIFAQGDAGYSGSSKNTPAAAAPIMSTPPLANEIPDAYIWGGDKLAQGPRNVDGATDA